MNNPNWEECKNCQYCHTKDGESGWYCNATNEQVETDDSVPCKEVADE